MARTSKSVVCPNCRGTGRIGDQGEDFCQCPVGAALAKSTVVKRDGRNCFGIAWCKTEADAGAYGRFVSRRGDTYNGGFYNGMQCGRDSGFDYEDPALGQLYAITER